MRGVVGQVRAELALAGHVDLVREDLADARAELDDGSDERLHGDPVWSALGDEGRGLMSLRSMSALRSDSSRSPSWGVLSSTVLSGTNQIILKLLRDSLANFPQ